MRFPASRLLEAAGAPFTPATCLVSPGWLASNLSAVTVLDGSWYMPAAGRNTAAEHAAGPRIPGSRHFDIDAIADRSTTLPHMLPPAEQFVAAMAALGVAKARPVVVYDTAGLFSAARVWWTLRAFGHPRVGVLDGGLPAWAAAGHPVETGPLPAAPAPAAAPPEDWGVDPAMVVDMAAVGAIVAAPVGGRQDVLVDARPAARFAGEAPEPRAGLRSGHMPGARSLPFNVLLDAGDHNRLRPEAELRRAFAEAGAPVGGDVGGGGAASATRVVTTCGSGVTASVLYLALAACGRPFGAGAPGGGTALYDGSWSEYGAGPHPVATGPPQ